MRYIRFTFMFVIGLALVIVAVANRQPVSLKLLPDDLADILQISSSIELPLFLVILAGVLAGLLIGFVWEYLREFKHRANLSKSSKEVTRLQQEVQSLRSKTADGKDDVLALIE